MYTYLCAWVYVSFSVHVSMYVYVYIYISMCLYVLVSIYCMYHVSFSVCIDLCIHTLWVDGCLDKHRWGCGWICVYLLYNMYILYVYV